MPDDHDRWSDIRIRLSSEREEIESELSRQRLLDELSASRTRNLELETALAKLAREQDRVALIERERLFKRAQIAQATSVLVHEANWAKNRMDAELKIAKQRAMLFPETMMTASLNLSASKPSGFSPGAGPFHIPPIKAPAPIPWEGSVPVPPPGPSAEVKSVVDSGIVPERRASVEKPTDNSEAQTLTISNETEKSRHESLKDQVPPSVAVNPPVEGPSMAIDILPAPEAIQSAITDTYTNIMSSVFGKSEDTVIPKAEMQESTVQEKSQEGLDLPADSLMNEPVAAAQSKTEPPTISPSSPQDRIVHKQETSNIQPLTAKLERTTPVVMPLRTQLRMEDSKKVLKTGVRGLWTNTELQAQASEVLSQLVEERNIVILSKPALLATMFGLPFGETQASPTTQFPPDWSKLADEWVRSVSSPDPPAGEKKKPRQETKLDPAIASLAGVNPELPGSNELKESDPNPGNDARISSTTAQEAPIEREKVTETDTGGKQKAKKGCNIM